MITNEWEQFDFSFGRNFWLVSFLMSAAAAAEDNTFVQKCGVKEPLAS